MSNAQRIKNLEREIHDLTRQIAKKEEEKSLLPELIPRDEQELSLNYYNHLSVREEIIDLRRLSVKKSEELEEVSKVVEATQQESIFFGK